LFPASDAAGRFGSAFDVENQQGIRNADGTFFALGQPLTNIQGQNVSGGAPLFGQFLDPRFEMPYSTQLSFGWSHQLTDSSMITADYVNNKGRDLNTRPRLNVYIPGTTTRRLAFLGLSPAAIGTRAASSFGSSEYQAMILGFKRRMTRGIDFTATYTLQEAKSNIGSAVDELNANNLIDAIQLYDDPRVWGPTSRTDARHSGTILGVFQMKWGIQLSPLFIFRTALPISLAEGRDLNANSENNDLPAKAYAFDGFNDDGTAKVKEIGDCSNYNCGRGAARTQFNLRGSKVFMVRNVRIEAIAEIFNLFNALNPNNFNPTRLLGTGAANTGFMQPREFSGDFQNPEQRVGQVGFRVSF
jgi:hypothetical protein